MPDKSVMWTNITDERFMNWMRVAAMPNFRKLWGRIEDDLPAGTYTLTIDNSIFPFIQSSILVLLEERSTLWFLNPIFLAPRISFSPLPILLREGCAFLLALGLLLEKYLKNLKHNDYSIHIYYSQMFIFLRRDLFLSQLSEKI